MGQLDTDRAARRRQIQMTQDLIAPHARAARLRQRSERRRDDHDQPLELILARARDQPAIDAKPPTIAP